VPGKRRSDRHTPRKSDDARRSRFPPQAAGDPADDATRLVHADWLEERGDDVGAARARFLRLTARMLDPDRPAEDEDELRRLAACLDTAGCCCRTSSMEIEA